MSQWIEGGEEGPRLHAPRRRRNEGQARRSAQADRSCCTLTRATTHPAAPRKRAQFRDRQKDMKKLGAAVLGVSTDDVASHAKFRDKFSLNFPLLADVNHKVTEKYGAWREKNMYGKKSWGVRRSTWLIDPNGVVRKVWEKSP